MSRDDLMHRLWWLRRHQAEAVADALLVEPVPATEDEVEERLPEMAPSMVTQIADSLLR